MTWRHIPAYLATFFLGLGAVVYIATGGRTDLAREYIVWCVAIGAVFALIVAFTWKRRP